MNLDTIPVIDTHSHPFPPEMVEITAQQIRDSIAVSLRGPSPEENNSMLLSRMMLRELAGLLGCEAIWPAVIEARNSLARQDARAYYRLLFEHVNIASILIDPGFPSEPLILGDAFADIMPCPVFDGYRIERFLARVPLRELGYRTLVDLVDAFKMTLDQEARNPRIRFYKSVIAYLTGLALRPISEAEALAAWANHTVVGDPAEKIVRDYLFQVTALKSAEHGLPFQVHTGHTAQTNLWPNANPIQLTPLLNDPSMQATSFVLVHGGYPYCTEAGYMTSVYPNVALDISLMIPWSSIGIAARIEQTLEAAPTHKIMYGSDAIFVPELFWISALNGRRALGRVLDRLVNEQVLGTVEALEVARDILYRNAERIYTVPLG